MAGLHDGQFRRRHQSGFEAPLWARLAQGAMRRYAPAAMAPLAAVATTLLPPGALRLAEVILAHPDEPLALLPFDIHPK